MKFTVVSLGGAVAPEGEDMLRTADTISIATGPYPKKEEVIALLAEHQADAIVVRLVDRVDETIMRASPRLKVVAKHGAGTNDIDLVAKAWACRFSPPSDATPTRSPNMHWP